MEKKMHRSKLGEAKEAEKRNNRAIFVGLVIILLGSIGFVTFKSRMSKFPH